MKTQVAQRVRKDGTPYNPSIGGAFSNNAFGEGAIKLDITPEAFKIITEHLQVGGSIVFRKNKVTSVGNTHYFTEILPPYDGSKKPVKATEGSLD